MKGYTNKMLVIDLTKKEYKVEDIPEDWLRDYIGGEGTAIRLLYEHIRKDKDPLDEEQPLIFSTGPLTGTSAPSSGRWDLVFYSPATGTIGASNCGGRLAPQIKKAGYDMMMVKGKAESPTYITIMDDEVKFHDASKLWGKGVSDTEDMIREKIGIEGVKIASIGQAGENKVMFASVMDDKHRAAGRGGAGAVMGSKNLKAVAVKGTSDIPVTDEEKLKEESKKAREELFEEAFVRDELKSYGTPSFYDSIDDLDMLPTKNWQNTTFPDGREFLNHEAYHETLDVKAYACHGCPIACGRHTEIKEGKYKGESGGGPEYETVAAFGSKCLVKDLNSIAKANYVANDAGMDVISAGQVIATAMEWFDEGIIDEEDTDGIDLNWGNGEAVIELVEKIAERDGFGDVLAEGVKRAAEKYGEKAERAAMHVKGLEMAADGVRSTKGEGVVHAVSPRGADHLRPWAPTIDSFGYRDEELGIEGEDIDNLEDGNKWWIKPFQELSMATNMLGVCLFTVITLANKASTYAKLLSTATGEEYSKDDLLKAAERVINMERMINVSLGFDREDDSLPERFLKEPAPEGRGKGQTVDLEAALDSYYESMGWDIEAGKPTDEKLEELGLEWMK
ncbi:MAG: aldehyde ferredoxin oxidoreductase family protein [Thermoplasmatota archaeon]